MTTAVSKLDLEQQFLEEIATEQWHADIVGGSVAIDQLDVTDQKLATIKLSRDSLRYRAAYERVRQRV